MFERKRLSDILLNSERDRLTKAWTVTAAAAEMGPIPADEYRCRIIDGGLFVSKTGTPGYKLTFEVLDGDFAGRRVWHDIWISEAALPMAKRDLAKLQITSPEQMESPLPEGIIVSAKVALRRGDDGAEFNRITRFEVTGFEPPEPDSFAPPDTLDEDGFDWQAGEQKEGGEQS